MQTEHKTLLDGVIVVFQNFKTLILCQDLNLPSSVAIERVPATFYRSSTTFSSYNKLIKISFGYHDGIPLDVIVAYRKVAFRRVHNFSDNSDSEDDPSEDVEEQTDTRTRGDFGTIRNCFIESMNQSVLEIGCWKFRCCKLYSEVLERRGCNCFMTRKILCRDNNATKFGSVLFEKFQALLREKLQNRRVDVFFTLRYLGQNISYSLAELVLAKCKLKYALELLIHCARDYWVPGYAMFWNTKEVKKICGSPKMEYYPGLMKGCGNLYFEYNHNKNAEMDVKLRKCYSELFKEIDILGMKKTPPFSQALLKYYLCEQFKLDRNIDYFQWVLSVLQTLDKYNDASTKFLCCRQELICSCLKLSELNWPDILEDMKQSLSSQSIDSSKSFKAIKLDRFLNYLNGLMKPLLYCVGNEVSKKKLDEELGRFYYVNDDLLRLVCACEAVIAFALYGTAEWRKNKPMFPKEIRDELGLSKKNFMCNESRISSQDICVGTNGLLNLKIEGNDVTCTAKFPLNRELTIFLSDDARNKLHECFDQYLLDNTNQVVLKDISAILLEVIIDFSKIENKVNNNSSWDILRDAGLQTYANIVPATPEQYCRFLFGNMFLYYNQVLPIVLQCKFVLKNDIFKIFQKVFAKTIEDQVLQKGCMLVVPLQKNRNFAILPVMPFRKLRLNEFYTNPLIDDLKILYDKLFYKAYSDKQRFSRTVYKTLQTNLTCGSVEELLELVRKEM